MASRIPGVIAAGLLLLPGAVASQTVVGIARVPGVTITRDAPTPPGVVTPSAERPRYTPGLRRLHPGDLFHATPRTFAPGDERLPHRFHLRHFTRDYSGYSAYGGHDPYSGYGGYGYAGAFPVPSPPMLASLPRERLGPYEMASYPRRPGSLEGAAAQAVPAAPPGTPRTIYVIPRCYAGDTPPRAEQLPAGCDVRNVRRLPAS